MMQFTLLVCAIFLGVTYSLPERFPEGFQNEEYSPEDMRLLKAILADEQSKSVSEEGLPDVDESEQCVDLHESRICDFYANEYPGYCKGHGEFMSIYCRAACDFCKIKPPSPVKECKDLRAACSFFAKQFKGYCDYNNAFMTLNCAKSCGFCRSKFPSPPVPEEGINAYWTTGEWDKSCISNKKYRKVLCVHNDHDTEVPVKEEMCALVEDKPAETSDC